MIRAETAINTTGRYSLRGDCKSQDKNVNEITYYFETSLNIIEISEIQTSFSKNENHQWEKIELILVPPTACNGIFWRRKLLTEIEDMRKNTWIKICLGCSYECELCGSQPPLCSIITSVFCVLLTGAMMKKLALNLLKVSTVCMSAFCRTWKVFILENLYRSFGFGTERYITCVQIREVCCYSFTWV